MAHTRAALSKHSNRSAEASVPQHTPPHRGWDDKPPAPPQRVPPLSYSWAGAPRLTASVALLDEKRTAPPELLAEGYLLLALE